MSIVMDEKTTLQDDLFQLAKVSLQGQPSDAVLLLRKYAHRYRAAQPQFADDLIGLLRKSPVLVKPTRQVERTGLPLDRESRVPLVRLVDSLVLENEPIYNDATWSRLRQVVAEQQESERLFAAGVEPTRTVLFTGPPGVGKTLAAKWISRELSRPLATLDLSSVMSAFLGRTGTNLRTVLDFCRERDCVLLLDELDAVAKRRDDPTEIGELKRLVTVLLQEMDEWPSTCLLLAATNHDRLLDNAIWRRFETVVEFPMPDADSIAELLRDVLEIPVDSNWPTILSEALRDASFSDATQFARQALRISALYETDVETALRRLLTGTLERLTGFDKRQLATQLVQRGLASQRRASELTGVSRDTIRKYVKLVKETTPQSA